MALDPDGKLNMDLLKKDLAFFKETGDVTGKVTVDQVVDTSFAEAAVKELGRRRGELVRRMKSSRERRPAGRLFCSAPASSLRAKRSNPSDGSRLGGLPRRFAPRNDELISTPRQSAVGVRAFRSRKSRQRCDASTRTYSNIPQGSGLGWQSRINETLRESMKRS